MIRNKIERPFNVAFELELGFNGIQNSKAESAQFDMIQAKTALLPSWIR